MSSLEINCGCPQDEYIPEPEPEIEYQIEPEPEPEPKSNNCSEEETDIVIDIACICKNDIFIECDENIHNIYLDPIDINYKTFQKMFFPTKKCMKFNKCMTDKYKYRNYISLEPSFRKINTQPFHLLESIIQNIENDIGFNREYFTPDSLINITNEISSINTLVDMILIANKKITSLKWSNIMKLIRDKLLNIGQDYKSHTYLSVDLIINLIFTFNDITLKQTNIKYIFRVYFDIDYINKYIKCN